MADWPTSLPQNPLIDPYSEALPKLLIRTPMGSGPSKIRRLIGNNSRFISIVLDLTQAQVVIFEEFFLTTLLGGSLHFDWVHPRTGAACDCRIVSDESSGPSYKHIGGSDELTRVDFQLEILP